MSLLRQLLAFNKLLIPETRHHVAEHPNAIQSKAGQHFCKPLDT